MGVKSVSTASTTTDLNTQIEEFRAGKAKLSKDTLAEIREKMKADGQSTTDIDTVISDYDKIDLNRDGMSYDELQVYTKSAKLQGGKVRQNIFSKDQLSNLRDSLAAKGTDTSKLDSAISFFDAADSDGDGLVSASELKAYEDKQVLASFSGSSQSGSSSSLDGSTPSLMDILYS